MGGHILSANRKYQLCICYGEKRGKRSERVRLHFPYSLPDCFPGPLHCYAILWNMNLNQETLKKTKNGKSLSSKYILHSSGSNLISVKRKNKALPMFWNEASWVLQWGSFQKWTIRADVVLHNAVFLIPTEKLQLL